MSTLAIAGFLVLHLGSQNLAVLAVALYRHIRFHIF
jgi:hypothetical protein